jgi:hypothetical protein
MGRVRRWRGGRFFDWRRGGRYRFLERLRGLGGEGEDLVEERKKREEKYFRAT